MKIIYETSSTVTHEARNGTVQSADGVLDLKLAMPKELGGAGGATNPEQLFSAGYAACFASAMLRISRETKTEIGKPQVTAHVGLGWAGENRYALSARLEVALPEASFDEADAVIKGAHSICPYSKAVAGNVAVPITLTQWVNAPVGHCAIIVAG